MEYDWSIANGGETLRRKRPAFLKNRCSGSFLRSYSSRILCFCRVYVSKWRFHEAQPNNHTLQGRGDPRIYRPAGPAGDEGGPMTSPPTDSYRAFKEWHRAHFWHVLDSDLNEAGATFDRWSVWQAALVYSTKEAVRVCEAMEWRYPEKVKYGYNRGCKACAAEIAKGVGE